MEVVVTMVRLTTGVQRRAFLARPLQRLVRPLLLVTLGPPSGHFSFC
jgi:hypothetical protein